MDDSQSTIDEQPAPSVGLATSALHRMLEVLEPLTQDDRTRVLSAVLSFFQVPPGMASASRQPASSQAAPGANVPGMPQFASDRKLGAKAFLLEKAPQQDIERVACLAFYLAHHRDTPTFSTPDISALNTEAAQPRFGNPSQAVKNAIRAGLVTHATGGSKQLSAAGEQYVLALPQRDAARDILARYARRRRTVKRGDEELGDQD